MIFSYFKIQGVKMKVYTVEVNANFVAEALQARYDEVENLWACPASMSLWDQALDVVAECGLGKHVTSPSIFVDNYLVNGEFVSKIADVEQWLGDNQPNGEKDLDEAWLEYCENNAILFNDEYACLRF